LAFQFEFWGYWGRACERGGKLKNKKNKGMHREWKRIDRDLKVRETGHEMDPIGEAGTPDLTIRNNPSLKLNRMVNLPSKY